jgi:nucleotide-binding universal stress UspA family protein
VVVDGPVLVAFDGSPAADAALERGIVEARERGATLDVLTVTETPPTATAGLEGVLGTVAAVDFSPDGVIHAPLEVAPALAAARARVEQTGLEAQYLWTGGEPGRAIVEAAKSLGASLIVVGEHKGGALHSLLWADVADEVRKHAPCPVVVAAPEPS